ncbi:MAG: hypothetical protein Q9165_004445 [Trypethelium subeluteriae]
MSQYGDYDEPRRYRNTRTRPRERDEPEYVKEETYIERGHGAGPRDLVFRGRDDSVEDIPRDFPPPNSSNPRRRSMTREKYEYDDYSPPRRRARSHLSRREFDDGYYSDDSTGYGAPAAAGAAAGYAAGRAGRRHKDKRSERRRSYYSEDDYSPDPPRRERRKSGVTEVIEGLGLGGLAAKLTGKEKDDSRSESRSRSRSRVSKSRGHSRRRDDSSDSARSTRSNKNVKERKWAQAAQAALVAGAVEAFRTRKTPGPWTGAKGRRIATAAIGAGGIDGLLDRDPDKKSKRHLAEAVIGGLAANRVANGPSSRSRGRDRSVSPDAAPRSRSRSIFGRGRSRSRGDGGGGGGGGGSGIKELAAGGALAAAGKAIYDRIRSKSRGRNKSRSRSPSSDSEDDYVPNRRGRYAAARSAPSQYPENTSREIASRSGNPNDYAAQQAAAAPARDPNVGKEEGSSTDSESSTDLEQRRKKMRGKELITAGLATIATIHAAHGVYNSMEASEKRHKLVQEGEMTAEEARKKRSKAWLQDAAAVGIAALGIKGAFSEWKEMNEQRHSLHELEKRKREQRKRREKRQRQRQQNMYFAGNNPLMLGNGYQPPGQTAYADGNPYGQGGVPPPPMGAPTPRY